MVGHIFELAANRFYFQLFVYILHFIFKSVDFSVDSIWWRNATIVGNDLLGERAQYNMSNMRYIDLLLANQIAFIFRTNDKTD